MNELLDTADVSRITGLPERTFDQYAYNGRGPKFIKLGRHRRYDPADVQAWIDAHRRGGDVA